jgi:hypothetical protein
MEIQSEESPGISGQSMQTLLGFIASFVRPDLLVVQ